jgi:diguanylate cyclase (GGDEF)-like protein/PAS domain S-box-containing protein
VVEQVDVSNPLVEIRRDKSPIVNQAARQEFLRNCGLRQNAKSSLRRLFFLLGSTMTVYGKCKIWLGASLHSATMASLILIAACWFVVAFVLSVERDKTIEGALKQSDGLVRLFEQNTVDVLERIDRTLLFLRKSFEDDPVHFDLRAWATRTSLVSDETLQLTLIGADGYQAASTTDYRGPPLYLGDREHFLKQLDPAVDKLFISEPVIGRASGKMSLQFSRRLRGPDGSFAGVIVISIDPNFIGRFHQAVNIGANGSVVLRNLDGVILAAQGLSGNAVGRQVKQQPFLDALAQSRSGHYWGGGAVDGNNRLVSFRTSEKFPLIFSIGLAENEILNEYRKHRTIYFTVASIVTLLILIAIAFNLRHQVKLDRSQEILKELNEEISKQNLRFDAALTNMPNGISMFDADGKLLVWNDRYVTIYGMSPDVIGHGVSIHTIVGHRKQAGNLDMDVEAYVGEFRQALIDFGMSTSATRLKDGRTVSVTNTAIAGGGWVGIHEDVTDRIYREQEIFDQATELARTNMRFEAALGNMTQGLCLFDAEKKLVIANNRFRDMYGLPAELTVPGTPLPLILQHHVDRGAKSDLTVDEHVEQMPTTPQQHFTTPDGRDISIKRAPTPEGGWVATHEDVTDQRRQEKLIAEKATELEIINDRFDAALSNMTQGISMFDGRRRLVVWNARYAEIYQLPQNLLKVGTSREDIADYIVSNGIARDRAADSDRENRDYDVGGHPTDRSSSRIEELNDGRVILLSRQAMSDGGWLTTHEDITERRRAEKEIIHLARHDPLTGLANRAEFNAKLEEATKSLKRNGGAVTVMMLDLDKFKAVNDTLGHPAGDQLLIEVAGRLKSSVRKTDLLARLGGDEFAIIQESAPNQHQGATALALRIISAITQPFDLGGQQASVGTSIGIVLAPEHGADPEELLQRADLALYNVKAGGRNDFRVFRPEMLEVVHSQQSAESELRAAIARDEFELHYQPQIDAKTRLLCGFEALVRWRHPTKGLVPPNEFIPLAESTGLIVPLGEWVLQQACKDAASWPAGIKVAVNISAVQFKKGNLFDVILCTLVESGLVPERLELEITETALLENQGAHLATIRQLKNLGISLALDDFGTGHSSINYLTVFPFDKIKIDKSFTQGVLKRRDYKAVVASTLALARGLGTVTTAEGVETAEQFDYMRQAGVDLVQGYLFGRPVPASKLDLHDTALPKAMVA